MVNLFKIMTWIDNTTAILIDSKGIKMWYFIIVLVNFNYFNYKYKQI
jgi:hypothetical protein